MPPLSRQSDLVTSFYQLRVNITNSQPVPKNSNHDRAKGAEKKLVQTLRCFPPGSFSTRITAVHKLSVFLKDVYRPLLPCAHLSLKFAFGRRYLAFNIYTYSFIPRRSK